MPRQGQKSLRGQPELYNEVKVPTSLALTPTGQKLLETLAQTWQLSRSELIERIARGHILLKGKKDG
jgi:hypothetical protein